MTYRPLRVFGAVTDESIPLRMRERIVALYEQNKTRFAPAKPFMSAEEVVGTWLESSGTKFDLRQQERFLYAESQPGTWRLTPYALVLTWTKGRVDRLQAARRR